MKKWPVVSGEALLFIYLISLRIVKMITEFFKFYKNASLQLEVRIIPELLS